MKRNKKLLIVAVVVVVVAVTVTVIFFPKAQPERERNGSIVGDNPKGLSIEDVPGCVFTGAGYETLPCYESDEMRDSPKL